MGKVREMIKYSIVVPTLNERENILQTVFSCMKKICSSLEWKEFASRREANAPQDWSDYVQKMIVSPWRNAS